MKIVEFLLAWLMLGGMGTIFTYLMITGCKHMVGDNLLKKYVAQLNSFLEKSSLNRFLFVAFCLTIGLIPIWLAITVLFAYMFAGFIYSIIWQPQKI